MPIAFEPAENTLLAKKFYNDVALEQMRPIAAKYDELESVRAVFRGKLEELLQAVNLLIAPCMRSLPPSNADMERAVDDEDERAEFITFTAPFDYSGHPTITLPAGLSSNGLPKAFQLIGPHLSEPSLVRAGYAHEVMLGQMPHPEL